MSRPIIAQVNLLVKILTLAFRATLLGFPLALVGCTEGVLAPAGIIGNSDRLILLDSLAIMLAIVIPTILATLGVVWWFRAGNRKARYQPEWNYSGRLELIVWSIPTLVVLFLGGIAWISSHDLDPAEPIHSNVKALDIDVVSLDWKWLFIYPEQHIASVNHLTVPAGTPLHFHITSATVMNVFFVPRLGTQIYAMNGMATNLNLEADQPGIYPGIAAHFSGDGFSDMNFDVEAVLPTTFTAWASKTAAAGPDLDDAAYHELLKQSQKITPYTYKSVDDGLFDRIVSQILPPGEGPSDADPKKTVSPREEK